MRQATCSLPAAIRWAVVWAVVLVGVGLVWAVGWKIRQVAYQRTFDQLLQQAQLLEPILRQYLAPLLTAKSSGETSAAKQAFAEPASGQAKLSGCASWESRFSQTQQSIQELCVQMGRASQTRITLILPNGSVLSDSEENPNLMEPHGTRPEIAQALQGQSSTSLRYSHTLRQWMFYAAVPIQQGGQTLAVLRLAQAKEVVDRQLWSEWVWIGVSGGVIISMGLGVGFWYLAPLQRSWKNLLQGAHRLAQGDWSARISPAGPADCRQLADWLNALAHALQGRQQSLLAQQSELQAILASMTEGVVAVDCQRRILCLNPSAAELLGLEPSDPVGRPLEEISRYPELNRVVGQVLSGKETLLGEIRLPGPPAREVQLQATVLRQPDQQPLGALVVLRDLTRLRQLENLRREFVANVSHELKTPLTSIHGFVETLLDGALQDPVQAERFLKIIAEQTQRLQNLVEDLLSLSRIEQEAETQQIRLDQGPIREVLESAIDLCRHKAEEKQISIHLDCPEDLQASRNPALLEQAVVNLLDNAIKYSAQGQPIHLQAFQQGHEVVICVRDHGCGIPPEHLDRIFERFYRVDKARSRKLGGTGLGLAIVKHIALAHGGRVAVQSQVGQGSSFFIYLPCSRPTAPHTTEKS
ncbi:MAG: ATP-binding protein [Thermoguttaceae bacterium]|nr:ATP-binding protein [Thermoguttaceae bacterium]MDW8036759.1 ATP-binding protein [Thermoguttaceae bacterium]